MSSSDRLSRKRNVEPHSSGQGSRDSSCSSQVRCGCQYFQTDSLLPEKQSLVGIKPNITTIMNTLSKTNDMIAPVIDTETATNSQGQPANAAQGGTSPAADRAAQGASTSNAGGSGSSPVLASTSAPNTSGNTGDHEYEPITPMSTNRPTPPPILKVPSTSPDATSNDKPNDASNSKEKQYLKLPPDEEIVSAEDEDYEEEEEEFDEEEMEEEEMSEEQGEFDEEDEEMTAEELQAQMEERFFNQGAAKSSIPVKSKSQPGTSSAKPPSALKSEPAAQPQSFQEKLKTQADKFKATLQTMSKRKEAPKEGTDGGENEGEPPAKSRFKFPNRPKFDRSKFKLPNRPKLKMPERSSKFKMPERPKLKMPERPKFKMPERPKFSLPDRSKFKLPDRPKIQLPKLPKRSNSIKERGDATAGTSAMGSKKNLFDFGTYPRIFNKRKREETSQSESPHLKTESIPTTSSAPSTPLWKRANLTQKWGQMINELKAKEFHKKMKPNDDTSVSQSSSNNKPRTFPGTESLDDSERQQTRSASSGLDTDKEQHSSGTSSLRDRKGVLEEINSDEFFLREKGLSRDNVDVSQFLTREIRDAFKADADKEESDFEDEEEIVPEPEEVPEKQRTPPQRSKSFSRFMSNTISRFHKKDKKELEEKKDQYKTYPPRKAERKRRESELFVVIPLKDENDPEFEPSIPVNDHTDEDYEVQRQVFKAVPKPKQEILPIPEPEKKSQTPDEKKEPTQVTPVTQVPEENKENVAPIQKVVQAQIEEYPSAPRRKKSLTQSLRSEGILKDVDNNRDNKSLRSVHSIMEPEPGLHQYPTPVAPRRRSRSLGTSLTSEDRTSRGADSMPSEEHEETVGYAIVEKNPVPPATPPRSKPPRPPPPCRRRRTFNIIRDQGLTNFFTFPRRKSYVEELPTVEKSYSTLGPTRPPRHKSKTREPVYADGSIHSEICYIDNESETKSLNIPDFVDDFKTEYGGSLEEKDLQSDDVIEKMKGRPLPAPPRPPRKSKQDGEDSDIEDIEQDAKMSGTTPPIDNIALNLHTEDISIAIQTDPLTDEYIVTNNEPVEEVIPSTRVVPLKGERKSLHPEKKVSEQPNQNEQLNNLDAPTLPLRRERRSLSKDDVKRDVKIINTAPTENSGSSVVHPPQAVAPSEEFCRQQPTARPLISAIQPLPRTTNLPESHDSPRPPPRRESPPKPPTRQRDNDSINGDVRRDGDRKVTVIPGPETEVTVLKAQKLQIQELDVDKIHVNELQASKITVHDVDSDVVNVSRINSTSGNLIIDNIELPSDILQSISQSITGAISFSSATMPSPRSQHLPSDTESAKQDHSTQVSPSQQSTQCQTQATPSAHESTQTKPEAPDTSDPVRPSRRRSSPDYSVPVPKYYRTRKYSYDSDDVMIVPIPVPRMRRRHHHSSDAAASSSTRDDSDSALDLGRRFINVVSSDIMSLIQTFISQLPRGEKQQQRDVVQMFICIFITIFALFFLMGFGSGNKTIHTHHWDYQFPPPPP
ncbi:hypothetical protein M8J76_006057 [Diaphorina citri]|nr:hypothetical protein M8J76_006057 [Diaphorina citri]KAI5733916.1 hypothetical protein M8J77_000291 [Diaphorina citri]